MRWTGWGVVVLALVLVGCDSSTPATTSSCSFAVEQNGVDATYIDAAYSGRAVTGWTDEVIDGETVRHYDIVLASSDSTVIHGFNLRFDHALPLADGAFPISNLLGWSEEEPRFEVRYFYTRLDWPGLIPFEGNEGTIDIDIDAEGNASGTFTAQIKRTDVARSQRWDFTDVTASFDARFIGDLSAAETLSLDECPLP
ncbi:MAG: hypothetical protein AAGJ10_19235 [Bacteroidota bacterium]